MHPDAEGPAQPLPAPALSSTEVCCISSSMRHPLLSPLAIFALSSLDTLPLALPTHTLSAIAPIRGTFVLPLTSATSPASCGRASGYQRKLRCCCSGQTSCLFLVPPVDGESGRAPAAELQDCASIRDSGSIES